MNGFKTAWRLTCQRAGITGLTFRDPRRESGSRLLETPGVSLHEVRDYLGQASVTMTNTYLATKARGLKDAVAKREAARTNLAHTANAPTEATEHNPVTH